MQNRSMFQKKKGQLFYLKVIRLSEKVIRLSESYSLVCKLFAGLTLAPNRRSPKLVNRDQEKYAPMNSTALRAFFAFVRSSALFSLSLSLSLTHTLYL